MSHLPGCWHQQGGPSFRKHGTVFSLSLCNVDLHPLHGGGGRRVRLFWASARTRLCRWHLPVIPPRAPLTLIEPALPSRGTCAAGQHCPGHCRLPQAPQGEARDLPFSLQFVRHQLTSSPADNLGLNGHFWLSAQIQEVGCSKDNHSTNFLEALGIWGCWKAGLPLSEPASVTPGPFPTGPENPRAGGNRLQEAGLPSVCVGRPSLGVCRLGTVGAVMGTALTHEGERKQLSLGWAQVSKRQQRPGVPLLDLTSAS